MLSQEELSNQTLRQSKQCISGTFIYAAICAEGIVFVADSRANFRDKKRKIIFIDNIQKSFYPRKLSHSIFRDENFFGELC
ncbi:hypothetical protein [Zobellia nedashkovskayae]|uniref:hypothetical protein n=1 Tax=Zobellia nedashkovskayae TaxID=2779510 RepID=UPI001889C62F|nr:hypothetical protein [Zobellia nedashkovskayae]